MDNHKKLSKVQRKKILEKQTELRKHYARDRRLTARSAVRVRKAIQFYHQYCAEIGDILKVFGISRTDAGKLLRSIEGLALTVGVEQVDEMITNDEVHKLLIRSGLLPEREAIPRLSDWSIPKSSRS